MVIRSRAHSGVAGDAKERERESKSFDNLALLYEGLLTGIVRLQARRQHLSEGETFRRKTKATLNQIEQAAVSSGYDGRDVKETHFAVVAFLDSVVLHSNDAVQSEWERKTLQEELFGQRDAGVVFFEKLELFLSRRDSDQLADILEVYLLCLLLGFQGRFSGGLRGELESITEKVRRRINDIRGPNQEISPSATLPHDLTPPVPPVPVLGAKRFRLITLAAVIFTILSFLALKLYLIWSSERLLGKLHW
jgi:type VI secretion system protein ImpK